MGHWTTEEIAIVQEKVEEDALYKDIASALKEEGYERSPEAVRCFLKRNAATPKAQHSRVDLTAQLDVEYADAVADIESLKERILDINKSSFERVGRPKTKANTKILTISDLHIPFENTEVITHALANHNDADILIINGDLFEHYAVSSWPKHKEIVLKWEYQIAIEWLKLFSKTFKNVYLVAGNHEYRLKSYFAANISPAVSFMVDNDMLSRLAKGEDFDEDGNLVPAHNFTNVHYSPGLLSWYTKIGQCIFAHPRSFSSIPMRTAIETANGFLGREEFQAIVLGHTHKLGQLIWRDKLILEQGCCCVPMDYESDGKTKYLPQAFGYAIVYMDDEGNVDFDKTKPVYRGTGFAIKDGHNIKE